MALRVLVVDEEARQRVQRVLVFASDPKNYYVPGPSAKVPGDDPRHVAWLNDFRCVYSVTVHPEAGLLRHLSISVDNSKTALPNPVLAEEIAHLFGFLGTVRDWVIDVPKGSIPACVVIAQRTVSELEL